MHFDAHTSILLSSDFKREIFFGKQIVKRLLNLSSMSLHNFLVGFRYVTMHRQLGAGVFCARLCKLLNKSSPCLRFLVSSFRNLFASIEKPNQQNELQSLFYHFQRYFFCARNLFCSQSRLNQPAPHALPCIHNVFICILFDFVCG